MPIAPPAAEKHVLKSQSADLSEFPQLDGLSPEILCDLTARHGIDFATSLLYDRICCSPRHADFVRYIDGRNEVGLSDWTTPSPETLIAVVPALYRESEMDNPSSGRFIIEQSESLGYQTEWLPIPSMRTLDEGSALLLDWLRQRRQRTILFSLSRGSADVKAALAAREPGEEFEHLAAWVNISGTLKGCAIVNLLRRRRLRWAIIQWYQRFRGWDADLLLDLKHGPGTPLWDPLEPPGDLPIYHVMGFPLQQHYAPAVTRRAEQRWWKSARRMGMNNFGPHESAVVLSDLLDEPGQIYPVWGAPHWISPPWQIDPLLTRLLQYIEQ